MTGWPGEIWRSAGVVLEKNRHRVCLLVAQRPCNPWTYRLYEYHSRTIEWEDAEWQWVGGEPEQSGGAWAL